MKAVKISLMAAGVIALGGFIFTSSTFAGQESTPGLRVIRHADSDAAVVTRNTDFGRVQTVEVPAEVDQNIVLVPPPAELPEIRSKQMVTSSGAHASVVTATQNKHQASSQKPVQKRATAQKVKPEQLFSYVRLLNYAPHPLSEDFLKKRPLSLNGKNYWLNVKYNEDWHVFNDEEGYIKALGFEINIMENKQPVRSLKTPKVKIDPKTISKGMLLGIAEAAPYRFKISVDEFTRTRKGISELVFKLDLMG